MPTDPACLSAKILIVDDDAAHVHLLQRLLQDAGYSQLSSTQDPQQVAALHHAQRFDLILLDLQMPVLNGFEVLAALQADAPPGAVLPVIALTAQPGHKLRALQAGARDFINKPFDVVEVEIRIHHMLEMALLHKRLAAHNAVLEATVLERTAALRDSEARYRSLTELATDWFWEQDHTGAFVRASGPALELLGQSAPLPDADAGIDAGATWEPAAREALLERVAARRPFLDLVVQRLRTDGSRQRFRVSGEPTFDRSCRFTGYRGIGAEVLPDAWVG
jgi:CheY-like chemotaxis protein